MIYVLSIILFYFFIIFFIYTLLCIVLEILAICFIHCHYLPPPFPSDKDSRKGKICPFYVLIHKKRKQSKNSLTITRSCFPEAARPEGISTPLCKLVKIGGFSMHWRIGNITLVPKCGSTNSCPSDYYPVTSIPVLFKVFEFL